MAMHDLAARIPAIGRLRAQRDAFAAELERLRPEVEQLRSERAAMGLAARDPAYFLYPPGHFYSPQPNLDEVRADGDRIWPDTVDIAGIDLRVDAQLALLASLEPELSWWPYYQPRGRGPSLRYRPDNDYFGHSDGQVLAALVRRYRPRRYVEIGCGWSSVLVLDLLDADPRLDPEVVLVEPYPDRLRSLLRPGDLDRARLIEHRAQDLDLEMFTELGAGDVLVVDSTHVSKIGSDVNRLIFEVFPRLAPGVVVHVHDIPYPFEYSKDWVFEGRAWNEAYLLRALLTENSRWQVLLWPSQLWQQHPDAMRRALGPEALVDSASLWLVRQ